jgi:hypothetical protein
MKKYLLILLVITLLSTVLQAATPYDFDGDGKSDIGFYRYQAAPNNLDEYIYWFISRSSDNSLFFQHWGANIYVNGASTYDVLRPADFDGDSKTDFAVQSLNNTIRVETFGRKIDKSTIIGDYDGDGKADLCTYGRLGKAYGFTYKGSLNNPNGNLTTVYLGDRLGLPYRGDFDGDGKLDFCVRITQTTLPPTFTLKRSSDSGIENINFGANTDNIAPGDYDGDGRTDFCVFRPNGSLFNWYILERDGGGTGAIPIVFGRTNSPYGVSEAFGGADFDGDRKSDIGVYVSLGGPTESNQGVFFIRKSADGVVISKDWGNGPAWGFRSIYYSNISQ